ncbi:MAG: 5'/3'-nucleotidase SurE [Syntrophothermus sp.]
MNKPTIFVTNDDGIEAKGIRELIAIMRKLGRVVVVAPDKPQSGTAHAITINTPLRLELLKEEEDYQEYRCNGTPADCVKLGFHVVLRGKPDILVSGINHGSNASISIIYSGTMAAVFEGAMSEVPSIGFSLLDYSPQAEFSHAREAIEKITLAAIREGIPKGTCLNVNIPGQSNGGIKGIKVCRQASGSWQEEFDERKDPVGRDYFWLTGVYMKADNGKDTDEDALEANYISVVPVQFDFTAHQAISTIKKWKLDV